MTEALLEALRLRQPQYFAGVSEARALDPLRFDRLSDLFLGWLREAYPEQGLEGAVDAYADFTLAVNLAQARYEKTRRYPCDSGEDSYAQLYGNHEEMHSYLLGVLCTLFMWPHHLEIARFFEDRFLSRVGPGQRIIELAPGHGAWGLWALSRTSGTRLDGIDISPTSVETAQALARAAGLEERAHYRVGDAMDLDNAEDQAYGFGISGFVVEHLERPELMFQALARRIVPGGLAFLTGALTAAQVDHIWEFVRESELVLLAEAAGFRVVETFSGAPARTFPHAHYLPRSMALLMQRRQGDNW